MCGILRVDRSILSPPFVPLFNCYWNFFQHTGLVLFVLTIKCGIRCWTTVNTTQDTTLLLMIMMMSVMCWFPRWSQWMTVMTCFCLIKRVDWDIWHHLLLSPPPFSDHQLLWSALLVIGVGLVTFHSNSWQNNTTIYSTGGVIKSENYNQWLMCMMIMWCVWYDWDSVVYFVSCLCSL